MERCAAGVPSRAGDVVLTADVLSRRALNRATLERQFLLRRADIGPLEAISTLVGMQAQVPHDPYTGLWSRLAGFVPDALSSLLLDRKVVRIVVMRGTIHLVTADDALLLRPLVQSVLDAELRRHPEFGPELRGVDLAPVLDVARELVAERPRTGTQLRVALAAQFPDLHAGALAYACRNMLPMVQVPPRGVWGRSAQVSSTTVESWLGRSPAVDPSIDDVVVRYLGAYGPAARADAAAWSRLTGFGDVFERLRPTLRTFRDERGRELFDLPDAPRPDPDVPAPTRFLPEYDNALLGHADRNRFAADPGPAWASTGPVRGTVLHDGVVVGVHRIERGAGSAVLVVEHSPTLPKRTTGELEDEGARYVRFVAPDATSHDVRLVSA